MNAKAAIFDLDGTLALMRGRKPFDWHRVGEDALNAPVADLLRMFQASGYAILVFSGRDAVCRKQTEVWLGQHEITYDELYMRRKNDNRKDYVVKREFYNDCVERYSIVYAVDDRPQVCRLWHKLGICLLKVGDPDADF